jgi:hypothetical protein
LTVVDIAASPAMDNVTRGRQTGRRGEERDVTDISNSADIIDVRDVIARVEELREAWSDETGESFEDFDLSGDDLRVGLGDEDGAELETLTELLDELRGHGGDEQWQGDWFPVTLIRDSYFEDYARELAEDIGAVPTDYSWPASHIDWEAAADALQQDYTTVEYGDVTYWYQ